MSKIGAVWPAVIITALILVFSAALLREGRLRDLDVARLGSLEAATLITEDIGNGTEVRNLPSSVTGWGIYFPEGAAVVNSGTAPMNLTFSRSNQILFEDWNDGVLRTVRTLPFASTPIGVSDGSGGHGRGMGMRRQVLIDWDIRAAGNTETWRILGVVGFTLMAVILLVLQQLSSRRIAVYRRNEENQRRLVQLGLAARTLTHEIRNPLGVLKAQQALLKKTLPVDNSENLSVIADEIDRLSALTDRVREWLADPAGNPLVFDVADELRNLMARQPWEILTDIPESRSYLRMDPALLASAVLNLVRNAVESMEETPGAAPPELILKSRGKHLQIIIKDRGKGLPDGDIDRLFDPFFTTKTKGSSVGLALSRQLIEAAGGTLKLENRDNGGVQAIIDLPREKA
jgi:nitrogen-specific signal transduction histidine kinase